MPVDASSIRRLIARDICKTCCCGVSADAGGACECIFEREGNSISSLEDSDPVSSSTSESSSFSEGSAFSGVGLIGGKS